MSDIVLITAKLQSWNDTLLFEAYLFFIRIVGGAPQIFWSNFFGKGNFRRKCGYKQIVTDASYDKNNRQ